MVEFPARTGAEGEAGSSTVTASGTYTWIRLGPRGDLRRLAPHPKPEGGMATKLDKTIKRELELEGKLYTVAISPEGVKVTPKGARKGHEVSWNTLVGGDTEPRRDTSTSGDAY